MQNAKPFALSVSNLGLSATSPSRRRQCLSRVKTKISTQAESSSTNSSATCNPKKNLSRVHKNGNAPRNTSCLRVWGSNQTGTKGSDIWPDAKKSKLTHNPPASYHSTSQYWVTELEHATCSASCSQVPTRTQQCLKPSRMVKWNGAVQHLA